MNPSVLHLFISLGNNCNYWSLKICKLILRAGRFCSEIFLFIGILSVVVGLRVIIFVCLILIFLIMVRRHFSLIVCFLLLDSLCLVLFLELMKALLKEAKYFMMDLDGFHISKELVFFSWTFFFHLKNMWYYNLLLCYVLENGNFYKDSFNLLTKKMDNCWNNHHY